MKDDAADNHDLTPDLLLHAYSIGIFPMAENREDPEVFWVDPKRRGILPLDGFHAARSLRRRMRKADVSVSLNRDFAGVLAACAAREETWINDEISRLYIALHDLGRAHSLEVWVGGDLVGGVYGVALGAAFFGESMFSRQREGSKIALACLVPHLRDCGYSLFDTQFVTPHLSSLGAVEISRAAYQHRLQAALQKRARIDLIPLAQPQDVVQRMTQISN